MKKLILFMMVFLSSLGANDDRIYLDENEVKVEKGSFYIHQGNNVWIETNSLHRDATGVFTFQNHLSCLEDTQSPNAAYVRKWRCPYCNSYWPEGSSCQNSNCPSRY